ncbi:MAG TPA: transcription-repair coupling factor [Tenericutes bacterium]|nr:transcription-repair coupling factor [Mycoplasmatota bacterium]
MNVFENMFRNLKNNVQIIGLNDELKGIYINNLFKKQNENLLVITNTLYEANKLYQTILNHNDKTLIFPMDDFLTSEALAISPELKNTRLETLNKVLDEKYIIITDLLGYLRYLPPSKLYREKIYILKKGQEINQKNLIKSLIEIGYTRDSIVSKTGDIAIRGYIIDIFPIQFDNPIRIEFWGDNIESIREFDIDSQRTIKEINQIKIYPNTEFLTNDEINADTIKQSNLIQYGEIKNISDYLGNYTEIFINYNDLNNSYKILQEEIVNYNISIGENVNKKYMNNLYEIKKCDDDNIIYFNDFDNTLFNGLEIIKYQSGSVESFVGSVSQITNKIKDILNNKKTIIICVSDRNKLNKIIDNFSDIEILYTDENNIYKNRINIIIKKLTNGFEINNNVFISEREIFNLENKNYKYKNNFKIGTRIKDVVKLNSGDYIVHSIYGIGRYVGIKSLNKNGLQKDYLQIEYKNGDKLYVPVEKMEYISKYSTNENLIPKINSLNSTEWEKTKLKVRKKIESIASELLELYAKREASTGYKYISDTEEQIKFESEFPYEETLDQIKVIDEIKKDMESAKPMDRILCGDVGYGKTEVAFRAMFKAVLSGKQVALLCPTTILSNQHYNNALERFKNFPINIEILNRFVSKKKAEKLLKDLSEGKIDILIGTHRLLSNDVIFKDLGLLVVDEEQRFGVKHKEKIKQLKNNIDILTLSATPIPRTLQMAMTGIRSLSIIETPPIDRYPVQTYVLAENDRIIKDAIYKEISRNGQVFILYNKIEDIELKANEISRLTPGAKIITAHGQMPKSELENVMYKFINKEYDVLICTTIIETGIDIPSVNTLIIMDANNFGLSQLYQIRGRVGRTNKIAYCYLMYDKNKILSEIATKRLKVIKEFTELGSGFKIAMRDLSIRGAGDILGSEQSGYIDAIGIELFLKMLDEEIKKQQGYEIALEEKDENNLIDVSTKISDEYIYDEDIKIMIHQKINSIDSYEKLTEIKTEIEDRFGRISEELNIYMYAEWFEKTARKLKINKIKQTKNFIEITIEKDFFSNIDGQKLFFEVTNLSRMFRFSNRGNNLIIILDTVKLDKHYIYYLIELIKIIEKTKKI